MLHKEKTIKNIFLFAHFFYSVVMRNVALENSGRPFCVLFCSRFVWTSNKKDFKWMSTSKNALGHFYKNRQSKQLDFFTLLKRKGKGLFEIKNARCDFQRIEGSIWKTKISHMEKQLVWAISPGKYILVIDNNRHRCCTALTFGPPATPGNVAQAS